MAAQKHKTDAKSAGDAAKKPKNPSVGSESLQPEMMGLSADPGTLQRSLGLPRGNGNRVVPRIQRVYGNQTARRMISRVRKPGGNSQPLAIQRDSDDGLGGMEVGEGMESAIEGKRGTGRPLPDDTREQMEGGMGADFSGVRVHSDAESHDLNRALNARAFTTGEDVFFGEGEYNPGSSGGQELIAHEMTHVVQQGGTDFPTPQGKLTVNGPGDEFEQEADQTATQVMSSPARDGAPPEQLFGAVLGLQRAEDPEKEKEKAKEAKKGEALSKGPDKSEAKGPKGSEPTQEGEPRKPKITPPPTVKPSIPPDEELVPSITEDVAAGKAAEAQEQTAEQLEATQWATAKPPDWDNAVAQQELFTALFSEEDGLVQEMATEDEGEGPQIQRVAGAGGGGGGGVNLVVPEGGYIDPQTGEKVPPPPKDIDDVTAIDKSKVTFGNSIGGKIGNALLAGPVTGNFADMCNIAGGISKETNPFGVIATLLDIIIKLLELVSGILRDFADIGHPGWSILCPELYSVLPVLCRLVFGHVLCGRQDRRDYLPPRRGKNEPAGVLDGLPRPVDPVDAGAGQIGQRNSGPGQQDCGTCHRLCQRRHRGAVGHGAGHRQRRQSAQVQRCDQNRRRHRQRYCVAGQ